jgi:hypothetical protein
MFNNFSFTIYQKLKTRDMFQNIVDLYEFDHLLHIVMGVLTPAAPFNQKVSLTISLMDTHHNILREVGKRLAQTQKLYCLNILFNNLILL